MNIECTDACNLHCSSCGCPHGNNFMTPETFEAILSKLHRIKAYPQSAQIVHHWRGEPCLSPYLPELAEYTKSLGYRNYVSTNTVVPNLSNKPYVEKLLGNLTRLNVSVDGYDQRTLSMYRGKAASWKMLLKNLEVIGGVPTDCVKEMRVLMFKHNDGHENFYRKLAKQYNMTRISFSRPIINYKMKLTPREAWTWLSRNPKYQRYRKIKGRWWLKKGRCPTCVRASPPIISVHGSVHPCGNDWDLEYNLGNVLTDDWFLIKENFNKMKQAMRKQILPMCKTLCCTSDEDIDFRENMQ